MQSQSQLPADRITDFPAFDDLQRAILGGTAQAVEEAFATLDLSLGRMLAHFQQEAPFHNLSEQTRLALEDAFDMLRVELELLQKARAQDDHNALLEALDGALPWASTLAEGFAALAESTRDRPRHSEIPALHNLIEAWQAYRQGRLAGELVWDRFDQAAEYHNRLVAGLDRLVPQGAEARVWADQESRFRAALELQESALGALSQALESGQMTVLEDALADLVDASEALVEVHKNLLAAAAPAVLSCPRCGSEYGERDRYCQGCQAMLPRVVQEVESLATAPASSDNVARMRRSLESALSGLDEQLATDLDWFADLLRRARRQTWQEPPEETPDAERDLLEAVKSLADQGLAAWTETLDSASEYLESGQVSYLNLALRGLEEGHQAFLQAHQEWERFARERT